jgi:hypothetical protein
MAHKRDYSPRSSAIHSRDAKVVQYMQINKCYAALPQSKGQKPCNHISVGAENAFD